MSRKATAYHEAGHAAAAWTLGFTTHRLTIIPKDNALGSMQHQSPLASIKLDIDGSDRARIRAEKAIVIALAGAVAQRKYSPHSYRRRHDAGDYRYASDVANCINGSEKMADAHLKWLNLWAQGIVDSRWRCIEALAKRLLEVGTLERDEVKDVLMRAIGVRQVTIHTA